MPRRPQSSANMAPSPPSFLAAMTEQEYNALPPSVQRKYFSSLEQLRIAERSANLLPDINCLPIRPQTSNTSRLQSSRQRTRSTRRLRKPRAVYNDYAISNAEAQWFLSLPEKVQKRYFSREEAVLLAGRCETFLVDSDDEAPSKRSDPSEHGFPSFAKDIIRERRESLQGDSVIDHHFFDSEVPDPLITPFDMPRHGPNSKRSSFRRTMSLSGPFSRISTSSAPPPPSPVFPGAQSTWRPRASTHVQVPRYGGESLDPEAKYYQDPEARMKLRLYLASPQKFDEAVEFGFPSTANAEAQRQNRVGQCTGQASRDFQTFLRDDAVSFLNNSDVEEEDSDDDSTVGDFDTPVTPLDHEDGFRCRSRGTPTSNMSSLDSADVAPLNLRQPKKLTDMYTQALSGNREMTLRMTLTRPDLRADEDALYGWQEKSKDNPMALEELPPLTDDTTGKYSPFNANSRQAGLVKKLFKRVKKNK
ncbi:hypothetical protein K490DRAFT_64764 [Saccharata proteae CBS 121410]|uniref:Mucin-like protein n=1 Tax=Saccharata proteae CBS 121410 TaxID=1314787 RepID=A0A9P4HU51_9PEZI|nr:hypothetical protein K490DRAFT_64764 [Saccharata proteae CBS 121410]